MLRNVIHGVKLGFQFSLIGEDTYIVGYLNDGGKHAKVDADIIR